MADADKSKKNRDGDLSKTADYGDLAPPKAENREPSARLLPLR